MSLLKFKKQIKLEELKKVDLTLYNEEGFHKHINNPHAICADIDKSISCMNVSCDECPLYTPDKIKAFIKEKEKITLKLFISKFLNKFL